MINKYFPSFLGATFLFLASSEAFAVAPPIPEPESITLIGIGAVVLFVSRYKRK